MVPDMVKIHSDMERDVASPWKERLIMVLWVVGSIPHGEPIELFLVPASAPRLV